MHLLTSPGRYSVAACLYRKDQTIDTHCILLDWKVTKQGKRAERGARLRRHAWRRRRPAERVLSSRCGAPLRACEPPAMSRAGSRRSSSVRRSSWHLCAHLWRPPKSARAAGAKKFRASGRSWIARRPSYAGVALMQSCRSTTRLCACPTRSSAWPCEFPATIISVTSGDATSMSYKNHLCVTLIVIGTVHDPVLRVSISAFA